MTALAEDRNTPRAEGDLRSGPVAASMLIYAGALVCRNAAGYLVKGAAATGLAGVGRAEQRIEPSRVFERVDPWKPGTIQYSVQDTAEFVVTLQEVDPRPDCEGQTTPAPLSRGAER